MEPSPSSLKPRDFHFTIQHLMLVILIIGLVLGVSLNLPRNPDSRAWKDRLLSFHLVLIGFIIPQLTLLSYLLFAAPLVNARAKRFRTELSIVLGCLVETFAIGSLLFWVIVMAMVRD